MATYNATSCVVKPEMSLSDEGCSQGRRLTRKLSRIDAAHFLDFDQLFEHPELSANMQREAFANQDGDSVDEGIASFEYDEGSPASRSSVPEVDMNANNIRSSTISGFTRTDSINVRNLAFKEILRKHKESSQGFVGFRRRVANDMNSKYFSYCRCDDVVFMFLYTIIGIIYICAGCLGLLYCSEYFLIKIYLIADGILSIFIFPISIMKWTKQIGGCLNEDEKIGRGVFFFTIIFMRIIAGTLGTLMLVFEAHTFTSEEFLCMALVILLKVGVALEWAFLFFGIVVPLCFHVGIYLYANIYL